MVVGRPKIKRNKYGSTRGGERGGEKGRKTSRAARGALGSQLHAFGAHIRRQSDPGRHTPNRTMIRWFPGTDPPP